MADGRLKRLLCLCDYPPSTAGGAPVIVRRLLEGFDPDGLHVLCDAGQHDATPLIRSTFLPCRHTTVPRIRVLARRPRRILGPLDETVHALRVSKILAAGRRIVREERIEALFTVPWRAEFALAAHRLSRETGLPLYVFETDDWQGMNAQLLPRRMVRRHHTALLRSAAHLWLTSPAMVRRYREQHGVEGSFLFYYVDPERYEPRPIEPLPADGRPLRMLYTGAINQMFMDAMERLCDQLNAGLEVDGHPLRLSIYSGHVPPRLLGPAVTHEGFVRSDDVPALLRDADVLLVAVSSTEEPAINRLVRTSLYTKTVDYLASGRPLLLISPPWSSELDYFGDYATVVGSSERDELIGALERIVRADGEVVRRAAAGRELIEREHSRGALERDFLRHFRIDEPQRSPEPVPA